MRERLPWGLTVVCVLGFAMLTGLGFWQAQRMQWKGRLIAQAEAAAAQPPAPLAGVLALQDSEFRKVLVDCPGLATAPWIELQSIHDGQAGVRLISACRPPDLPDVFLVDRGFVSDDVSARPPVATSVAPLRLVAELRQTPPPGPMALPAENGRFFARDTPGMARALGVSDPHPKILFALTSSNPEWRALRPSAPPAAFSNNHLGYAITWFGLALALAGFYIALLRRKPSLMQPRSANDASGKKETS